MKKKYSRKKRRNVRHWNRIYIRFERDWWTWWGRRKADFTHYTTSPSGHTARATRPVACNVYAAFFPSFLYHLHKSARPRVPRRLAGEKSKRIEEEENRDDGNKEKKGVMEGGNVRREWRGSLITSLFKGGSAGRGRGKRNKHPLAGEFTHHIMAMCGQQ